MAPATTSLDKALDLLFHLHGQPCPCGVTEIGRALGLSRSSVHRLLSGLARRGLVDRTSRGRYQPGSALLALGLGVQQRDPVVSLARPALEEQAAASGETVFLTAPWAGGVRVLDKVEGEGFLRAAPRVGDRVPVHATAVGRVALAFAPYATPFPPAPLESFTPWTLADRAGLEVAVERTRASGFAQSHGEWIAGLSAVAVPVFGKVAGGAGRRMLASLALAAATPRMQCLGVPRVAGQLLAAAASVEARLAGPLVSDGALEGITRATVLEPAEQADGSPPIVPGPSAAAGAADAG